MNIFASEMEPDESNTCATFAACLSGRTISKYSFDFRMKLSIKTHKSWGVWYGTEQHPASLFPRLKTDTIHALTLFTHFCHSSARMPDRRRPTWSIPMPVRLPRWPGSGRSAGHANFCMYSVITDCYDKNHAAHIHQEKIKRKVFFYFAANRTRLVHADWFF